MSKLKRCQVRLSLHAREHGHLSTVYRRERVRAWSRRLSAGLPQHVGIVLLCLPRRLPAAARLRQLYRCFARGITYRPTVFFLACMSIWNKFVHCQVATVTCGPALLDNYRQISQNKALSLVKCTPWPEKNGPPEQNAVKCTIYNTI